MNNEDKPLASRQALANIYRPAGPKVIQQGIPWTSGGSAQILQAIDLSLPIRGIRLSFKGRITVGTAAFTTVTPEGLLNLISNVTIQGTNARQKGNLTLWNLDLATAWVYQHMFSYRKAYFSTNSGTGETLVPIPSTPFPSTPAGGTASPYFSGTVGNIDFRIIVDFPFHPHQSNSFGRQPLIIPAFLVRNEEWKDSLQVLLSFGAQTGTTSGVLGTPAATTTVTFSGFGGVGVNPTIDLYSLPVLMGLDLKDQVLPGVISRVNLPVNTPLQSAGTNVVLTNLQKQPTPRILSKFGTATAPPAFATLSDTNVTTIGVLLGGNRNVRNKVDIFAHKYHQVDIYDRDPIQGYMLFDFMDQGNPDSAYPGQDIGDGATYQIIADVTGVAQAFGLFLQEQMLHMPTGALYTY